MKAFSIGLLVIASISACSASGRTVSDSKVSQSAADPWPAKWCRAEPGITKEALTAIMGAPTGSSDATMSWSAHQYQFNAFLDSSGTVNQLDINTYSLSAAEKASLKCETIRTRASMARAASRSVAKAPRKFAAACTLVTAVEMSAILDVPIVAEANDRSSDKTECNYKPVSGFSPAVKLSVDWGDGEAAMSATGMMGRHEPGLTSPYDGIGDQAAAVGPALMIRTGEDLVTIVFTGVSDPPAKARRIFETAKPRM